jgi:RNA polymerase sigma-70 factor (ECF subfamily)
MSDAQPASVSGGGSEPSSATNRSLLQHVQAGNPDAWDRLAGLYAPLVLGWCRRGELQTADTADIVQEVFLAVATHVSGFRKQSPRDTFRGWLRTITRNKINDHFRRLGREPEGEGGTQAGIRLSQMPEPMHSLQPEDPSELDASAERSLFRRALASIRGEFEPRTWQAFWSTTIEGRTPKDVAADMGMSSGAVRVAKSRVLQRLRDELGDFTGL